MVAAAFFDGPGLFWYRAISGNRLPESWQIPMYEWQNPVTHCGSAMDTIPVTYRKYRLHTFESPRSTKRVQCFVLEGLAPDRHAIEIYSRLNPMRPWEKKEATVPSVTRVPVIKGEDNDVAYQRVELRQIPGQVHVIINDVIVANVYGTEIYFRTGALGRLGFKVSTNL